MHILIREENFNDYKETEKVVEKAFENEELTDHAEHLLVARIRESDAFIPELSLVAEQDGEIVGHIMLSKISIKNEENEYDSLAMAPVSVLPEYQNKGIGNQLIRQSIADAQKLGFKSIIVLGHASYYPQFGFTPASTWNIKAPFEVPDEAFMAIELEAGALD